MSFFRGSVAIAVGVALSLGGSAGARAALGGDAQSVTVVTARFAAQHRQTRAPLYRVHALAVADGPVIREYENPAGRIFAVSWAGAGRPDLRVLLGAHYGDYLAATRGRRRARGPHRLEGAGLIIVQGGTARALFGKVVLAADLPAGVRVEDLP